MATGLGLGAGDPAAIVAGNCVEYIEIVDGLAEAGLAVATVNPRQTAAEVCFILSDCGARIVFVTPESEDLVRASDCPSAEWVMVIGPDYEAVLQRTSPGAAMPIAEWQAFSIPYTSGTTCKPRGVMLPHRSRVLLGLLAAAALHAVLTDRMRGGAASRPAGSASTSSRGGRKRNTAKWASGRVRRIFSVDISIALNTSRSCASFGKMARRASRASFPKWKIAGSAPGPRACPPWSRPGRAEPGSNSPPNMPTTISVWARASTPRSSSPRPSPASSKPARAGRTVGAYALFMVITDETDGAAQDKWGLYRSGKDVEALSWMGVQAAADDMADTSSTACYMTNPVSAVNFNMGTLVSSHATVAALLDEVATVAGIMLTFDDFLAGMEAFGERIQPLMVCRQRVLAPA